MLTTIEGTCREDGLVQLSEAAPAASAGRKVLVVFVEPVALSPLSKPAPGPRPRFSWDEALARTAHLDGSVSLADEVVAERRERD